MMNHPVQKASGRVSARAEAIRVPVGIAVRTSFVFIVLCGLLYPLVTTGAAQLLMPKQANGSLIEDRSGNVVGSELIGQSFTDPKYFHGRLSSIEYDGAGSGSNNYAPSNPEMLERTKAEIEAWKKNNPGVPARELPIDLVTNSGSGLDPHITRKSAEVQIPRVSERTGIAEAELKRMVKEHTEGRDFGVFGEPRVNVLKLNLALQELLKHD